MLSFFGFSQKPDLRTKTKVGIDILYSGETTWISRDTPAIISDVITNDVVSYKNHMKTMTNDLLFLTQTANGLIKKIVIEADINFRDDDSLEVHYTLKSSFTCLEDALMQLKKLELGKFEHYEPSNAMLVHRFIINYENLKTRGLLEETLLTTIDQSDFDSPIPSPTDLEKQSSNSDSILRSRIF